MPHTLMDNPDDPRQQYLDLMKRALINWIYVDVELRLVRPRRWYKQVLVQALKKLGFQLARSSQSLDWGRREEGRDVPPFAHTMIGWQRVDHLHWCVEQTLLDNIPGDYIETGVCQGGAGILMRAVLKAYGVRDRRVWLADSFAGPPPPNPDKYPHDIGNKFHTISELAVPLERVQANFERYGLLDDQVRFLKGWFRDTLPVAPIDQLAILRLAGDMYESTMDALTCLYSKLSLGGFVLVDNYCVWPSCYRAVQDYRIKHGITEAIISIDWAAVYWRRER